MKRALLALVLLTSACAVTGTAVPVGGNLALVDARRTGAALDAVKAAAEAVFSYDSGNPGAFDQAVAANVTGPAKDQLTRLFAEVTTDRGDPEGSYARAEAVLAEPLLSDYRAKKASYVDAIRRSGTKVALGPDPMAGVVALTGGRGIVLFFTNLQVTAPTGQPTSRPFTTELDVVREGAGWKATAVRPLTVS